MKFFANGREIQASIKSGAIVCDDPSVSPSDSFDLVARNGSPNVVSATVEARMIDGVVVLESISEPMVV